ncbi:hypothetical protein LCGC14_2996920, partial [marine sediment metagenome]
STQDSDDKHGIFWVLGFQMGYVRFGLCFTLFDKW